MNNTTSQQHSPAPKSKVSHTKRKGPYLVVNMTGKWDGMKSLPYNQKPHKIHHDLKSAAFEAVRLGQMFPDQEFAIYECIGSVSGK